MLVTDAAVTAGAGLLLLEEKNETMLNMSKACLSTFHHHIVYVATTAETTYITEYITQFYAIKCEVWRQNLALVIYETWANTAL